MIRTWAYVAMLCVGFAGAAMAGNNNNQNHSTNVTAQGGSGGNATSISGALATGGNATANGGAALAVSGNSSATAPTSVGGQSVNIDTPKIAIAPALGGMASGPCTGVSTQGTVGLPALVSIGGGRSEIDDQCTIRENIRIVNMIDPALAREMLNDLAGVKEARQRLQGKTAPVAAAGSASGVVAASAAVDYCQEVGRAFNCVWK